MTRLAGMVLALGFTATLVSMPGAAPRAQDALKCKGCVDTGDLAKKSVTGSRLKKAAVKANRIKDGAVTGPKIAAGAVDGGKLAPGAVTGGKLAAGAVAGAKIAAGAVTADKLDPEVLGDAVAFARTLLVSPVGDGTDFTANGQALLDALAALDTVVPPPGAANPWLIKLEAGVYDVGATSVQMRPFVDMEGAGPQATEIRGSTTAFQEGVVNGASNAELRRLGVLHDGNTTQPVIAISIVAAGFRVANVRVQVQNSSLPNTATGIFVGLGPAVITDSEIEVASPAEFTSAAVLISAEDVELVNVVANSLAVGGGASARSVGLSFAAGTGIFRNSRLSGQTSAVFSGASTFPTPDLHLISSQLTNGIEITGTITIDCVGSYSETFAALGVGCVP